MSETESVTTESTEETTEQVQETNAPEVFDREYVESLRKEAAKHRTEAKATAERLAEIEGQYKALTDEAGTKEAAANAAIEKANLTITRLTIGAKYGISPEEQELFLTASDEESLLKQAEALSKRSGQSVKPDTAQGTRGAGPKSPQADFAAWLDSQN